MSGGDFVKECVEKVLSGGTISLAEAEQLLSAPAPELFKGADLITRTLTGEKIDVEVLVNAKAGRCPEDCSFCAQSSFYDTGIAKYPLLSEETLMKNARDAKAQGAASFCIVCAYRSAPEKEFELLCNAIRKIRTEVQIDVNASLGFLTPEMAAKLKAAGVKRYNHNLEASESFFAKICSTHDYKDRIQTALIAKEAGMDLCSGGIFGMGETPRQRLELAFALSSLKPEEVPINLLIAKEGTPLSGSKPLDEIEAMVTVAVWRFIMPRTILKIAGGRERHLADNGRGLLRGGANGIITGGYLTSDGNEAARDLAMIEEIGLKHH